MKIQHSLLVSVFVIIAIGTLFMSIVKKETKKGILSEVTMVANNKIVLRFDNDSSLITLTFTKSKSMFRNLILNTLGNPSRLSTTNLFFSTQTIIL